MTPSTRLSTRSYVRINQNVCCSSAHCINSFLQGVQFFQNYKICLDHVGVVFREKVCGISRPFWYLCHVYFIIIITITFDIHPGVSPCQLKYFPIGLSPPSAISWGRSSPDRPSSSPSLNHTRRHLGTKQLARSPLTNNRFSRYMAKSVPDMKILSLEDPS